MQEGFIIPKKPTTVSSPLIDDCIPEDASNNSEEPAVSFADVVQVMGSYDMGWTTRGAGRSYDSLTGLGALIGSQTGKVLDYGTCNRKCKKCDMGHDKKDHNSRQNFDGSAKAMEPHVASKIVNHSTILKDLDLEVGILVGDDDSSTIKACRENSSHPIAKFSDTNHAAGDVRKELYKMAPRFSEMNKDAITYLHRCFTFAIAGNKGNSSALAAAIQSIPKHAYNDHSICGAWCGYIQDPENYDHNIIPGGFKNENLKVELENIFNQLALNATKFSPGASSNANESLNASMASKSDKRRCLSLSASSDYRFSQVIGQKNEGEDYTRHAAAKVALSPGKHHENHVSRITRVTERRRIKINTVEFKRRRMANKKLRSALRHKKEKNERVTYETNCSLLTESGVPEVQVDNIPEQLGNNLGDPIFYSENDEVEAVVLLNLETSGFQHNCDILQIAAACNGKKFNSFINPSVPVAATIANGLTAAYGELMLHGKKVTSMPLRVVLFNFLQWLESLGKPCYIVTHNLSYDGPRLHMTFVACNLDKELRYTVSGFIDSLALLRKITERRGKGESSISGLCALFKISCAGAHNAEADVRILGQVLHAAKVTHEMLLQNSKPWDVVTTIWKKNDEIRPRLTQLNCLKKVVGEGIRQKMVQANITNSLRYFYEKLGSEKVIKILTEKVDNKPLVTNNKKALERIIQWLQKNSRKKGYLPRIKF